MTLNERAKSDTGVKYECMFTSNNLDNTNCGKVQHCHFDIVM